MVDLRQMEIWMKKMTKYPVIVTVAALLLVSFTFPAGAQVMHPEIPLLDGQGKAVDNGQAAAPEKTCGTCHDSKWIQTHDSHREVEKRPTCFDCHVEDAGSWKGDALTAEGYVRKDHLRLTTPSASRCGRCHGLIHEGRTAFEIPPEFDVVKIPDKFALTRRTGEVIAGQHLVDSFINLQDKQNQARPWDVHASRKVDCAACHFAANNPEKAGRDSKTELVYLKKDPRKISVGAYLYRPDHQLEAAHCLDCHPPEESHKFLPYSERHLEVLQCQACHVPRLYGPAAQAIDQTALDQTGSPLISYRNTERKDGETPSAMYVKSYTPFLISESEPLQPTTVGAYNVVTYWQWIDENDKVVPPQTVKDAWFESDHYAAEVLALFDSNGDGRLSALENRLTSSDKTELIQRRLTNLGVESPRIHGKINFYSINHGIVASQFVSRDCASCHAHESRLNESIPLAPYIPHGADTPAFSNNKMLPAGDIMVVSPGLVLNRPRTAGGYYVPGHNRSGWSDWLGFIILLLTLAGIATHITGRILVSKPEASTASDILSRRVYMYTVYERIWHWTMAISVLLLLFTGFNIHFAGMVKLLPFATAVAIHNVLAGVLFLNAFLALFYHLASAEIRQFIPGRQGFWKRLVAMARYYSHGMFVGAHHPWRKSPDKKLNPLQQITYAVLLNILFPVQVITGVLLWIAGLQPAWTEVIGGLIWVGPIHNISSWLFLTFLIVHVYLTTTGHTVGAYLKAMVTGYEDLSEVEE